MRAHTPAAGGREADAQKWREGEVERNTKGERLARALDLTARVNKWNMLPENTSKKRLDDKTRQDKYGMGRRREEKRS